MEITIASWDKHNPRRDQRTYTWLKLSNDIGTDPDMFGYDAEEKFLWILLLCEASKKSSARLTINTTWLAHNSGIKIEKVESSIQKLKKDEFIQIHIDQALTAAVVHETEHDRPRSYSESSTTPILDNIRIDKNREETAASASGNLDGDPIPDEILSYLSMSLMYPKDLIESVRKDAWLIYMASQDPKKNWPRFIAAYFKNEKHRIEIQLLKGKVSQSAKASEKQEAQDMAAGIFNRVIAGGSHGLKQTLANFSIVENQAIEHFGRASEILSCTDFESVQIKSRLRDACHRAIIDQGVGKSRGAMAGTG